MKRSIIGTVTAVVISCMAMLTLTGCDTSQVKAVAQNAGLFAAVGWIAYDNPDADAKEAVKSILGVIEEKAADVAGGATYTEVVYPEVVKVIDKDVEPQYRPICKAGALSLLGGLDMLFAANPEWKQSQEVAIQVIDAFILGAKNGLNMADDHEIMEAAKATYKARAKVLVK